MIKIDREIPLLPPDHGKRKYPFKELEVGDSFVVENITQQQFSGITNYWSRRLDRKFTTRREGPNVRVFRQPVAGVDFPQELKNLIQKSLASGVDSDFIVDTMSAAWVSDEPEPE